MAWPEPLELHGVHCTLKPLTHEHLDALIAAVKDGELWNLNYTLVPKPEEMQKEIERRLLLQQQGLMLPFVVIYKKSQRVVGMTTYSHIEEINRRLNIGFTWYAKSVQRTAVNTDCKITLLTHAFEAVNCIAVGFRVDYLNRPSRLAVERLGAKYEGMVRNYALMPDGRVRDMCLYSILPQEWTAIKSHLKSLLENYHASA